MFAIQDQLYEPSRKHRRALINAASRLIRPMASGPTGILARRAQAMVRVVKSSAAALLVSEEGPSLPFRYYYPRDVSFTGFVAAGLWVYETEALAAALADAIGERLLHEGGDWRPAEPDIEGGAGPLRR